jgi:hypothetical protein
MTTAELGLVTTAAVGIAAAAGPFLTAWLNRGHDRAMVLYEQRRELYRELAGFLERQRVGLGELAPGGRVGELPQVSIEARSDLLGRVAVEGSSEMQKKQTAYSKAANSFRGAAMTFLPLEKNCQEAGTPPDGWAEANAAVKKARSEAYAAINDAERIMREELAKL